MPILFHLLSFGFRGREKGKEGKKERREEQLLRDIHKIFTGEEGA